GDYHRLLVRVAPFQMISGFPPEQRRFLTFPPSFPRGVRRISAPNGRSPCHRDAAGPPPEPPPPSPLRGQHRPSANHQTPDETPPSASCPNGGGAGCDTRARVPSFRSPAGRRSVFPRPGRFRREVR